MLRRGVVHDAFVTGPRKLEGAELAEIRRTAALVLAGLDDCSAVPAYYALLTFFPGSEGLPSDVTVSDVDASGGGAAAVNACLSAAVTGVRWPQGAEALTIIAVRKGTGADDKVRFGWWR